MKREIHKPFLAVIDTNVLVSALLSLHKGTSPAIVLVEMLQGRIQPLYNAEILAEYREVLSRDKFPFNEQDIDSLLNYISSFGINSERVETDRNLFPDPNDIVFYEVALSKEESYLITGNTRHFPPTSRVVTPTEMVAILETL